MRHAAVRIVRLLMRLAALYSFVLSGACLLLAVRSAVRLFVLNRAPNDSASGLDPIGVMLGFSGALAFAAAGRWAMKAARTFGAIGPTATASDGHQDEPS